MNPEFEQNITMRGVRKRTHMENNPLSVERSKTSRCTTIGDPSKTPIKQSLKQLSELTPRRSGRKSVKPVQDYYEIVGSRTMRSVSTFEGQNEETEHKWTPAKVGRVSQKRSTRKSGKQPKKQAEACPHENTQDYITAKNSEEGTVFSVAASVEENLTVEQFCSKNTGKTHAQEGIIISCDEHINHDLNITFDKSEEKEGMEKSSIVVDDFNDRGLSLITNDVEDRNDEDVKSSCLDEQAQKKCSSEKDFHITADSCDEHFARDLFLGEQKQYNEDIEMPSLLLCDEEEEDNEMVKNAKAKQTVISSDCIVISPLVKTESVGNEPTAKVPMSSNVVDSPLVEAEKKVKEIQVKYFTPNKKLIKSIPEIKVEPSTPILVEKHVKLASAKKTPQRKTPVSVKNVPRADGINPKSGKPGYRFTTPLKAQPDFKFSKTEHLENISAPSVVTSLEPKDIVLRSIRKRSLSVTIDGEQRKRKIQNVTFYSPANQTVTTDDLDQLLTKSIKKSNRKDKNQTKSPRKRSMSLDENYLPSRLPKLTQTITKSGKSPAKTTVRTKLPNFAAIHENQFQKMENLVDYVARKADRAQNITNWASKARNATLKSPRKILPEMASMLPLRVCNTSFLVTKSLASNLPQKDMSETTRKSPIMKEKPDKLQDRRERHMNILKGRAASKTDLKQKNNVIIKGVRSNRRFELLMQHRKTGGN